MIDFRDFLMRFRPTGSPGPAAPGGVPADRAAELSAEVAPTLSLLEPAEAEARAIREEAERRAERIRRSAAEEAERIRARARGTARVERTRVAGVLGDAADTETARMLSAAEHAAALTRRGTAERAPALAERALARILAELLPAPGGSP